MQETLFSKRLSVRENASALSGEELAGLGNDEIHSRLQSVVGNTPVRVIDLPNGNVLLQKLETENPTESHYDRCYRHLLAELEDSGACSRGDTLLETSSGSAGISFAWMARKLGFTPHVFMPSYVPEPRIVESRRFAEVHLNDDRVNYLKSCAQDMVAYFRVNRDAVKATGHRVYMPNHSQDARTPVAFESIVDEIMRQKEAMPVDYFIGGVGNGSTLLGVGRVLKRHFPDANVIGYEPTRACPFYVANKGRFSYIAPRVSSDEEIPAKWQVHGLTGTGGFGNIDFPFMNEAIRDGVIDDVCHVPDDRVLARVRYNEELPEEEQQGHTSLVSRFLAEQMAQTVHGKVFLTLAYDRADRYGVPRWA